MQHRSEIRDQLTYADLYANMTSVCKARNFPIEAIDLFTEHNDVFEILFNEWFGDLASEIQYARMIDNK